MKYKISDRCIALCCWQVPVMFCQRGADMRQKRASLVPSRCVGRKQQQASENSGIVLLWRAVYRSGAGLAGF